MLVICAGMPKAGSTLQFNLCKELLGEHLEEDHGWVTGAQWAQGFRPPTAGAGGGHVVLKCHRLPRWAHDEPDPDRRVVSTFRDLRDVAASAKEFEPHKGFDEILETLELTVTELGAMDGLDRCLIQRYETMVSDLPSTVIDLAEHLDIDVDPAEAAEIAGRWDVESTKERTATVQPAAAPKRRWWQRRRDDPAAQWDADTLLWPTHISSSEGRPGRYQGVLSAEEVATIEDRYGSWLHAHGY